MKVDPFFRKIIPPWYDSDIICILLMIGMIFVVMFGIAGFSVAKANKEFIEFIWVPSILIIMGGFVFISVSIRFVRRKF